MTTSIELSFMLHREAICEAVAAVIVPLLKLLNILTWLLEILFVW